MVASQFCSRELGGGGSGNSGKRVPLTGGGELTGGAMTGPDAGGAVTGPDAGGAITGPDSGGTVVGVGMGVCERLLSPPAA